MELAKKKKKKQSKPPAQWYCLEPQLQQEMNGFFFLGNVLLKKTCPGVGGRGAFTIQVSSGTWGDVPASHACLELLQVSAVGRNAHFYMKGNRTASVDISGQPGIFPSLKCYLGRCVSA